MSWGGGESGLYHSGVLLSPSLFDGRREEIQEGKELNTSFDLCYQFYNLGQQRGGKEGGRKK